MNLEFCHSIVESFDLFYLWVVGERLNGRTVNGHMVVRLNGFLYILNGAFTYSPV